MTREEAIKELKEEFEIFKNSVDPVDWENPNEELRKIIEANTMAIKALEIIGKLEKALPTVCTTTFEIYAYHKVLELEEVKDGV